jgi:hypothetical protein
LVKISETTTIAARTRQVITGKLVGNRRELKPSLVCVEPAQIPVQGIWAARGLAYVREENHGSHLADKDVLANHSNGTHHKLSTPHSTKVTSETQGHSTYDLVPGTVLVMVANFSDEPITLPKATILGIAEEVSESLVASINDGKETSIRSSEQRAQGKQKSSAENPKFQEYLKEKLSHLSRSERSAVEPVLIKYAHVFHDEESNEFKSSNVVEHRIETGDAPPIRRPQTGYHLRLGRRWKLRCKTC